jgi:uncharacterized membrane protein YcjF (UPF0283 family)
MASEQDLNSPDFRSNATSALGAAAMVQSAKGAPRWQRWLLWTFAAITALVVAAGMIDKVANWGSLPKCDAQRTRDTLSDLNKQNQVNASSYNFIKQVSASDTEVTCTANLALRDGGTLEYDYRIYKEGGAIKVQITNSRRQ